MLLKVGGAVFKVGGAEFTLRGAMLTVGGAPKQYPLNGTGDDFFLLLYFLNMINELTEQ